MNNIIVERLDRRVEEYRKNMRGIMHSFWAGTIDFDQFFELMFSQVRIGLTQAWYSGAAECGIAPADMTPEEKAKLNEKIFNETARISSVADFIEQNSKANGGKFATVKVRAALWGQRALDVFNTAKAMACGDEKLEWVWNPEKEHCSSCGRLNGKVKRASYWVRVGILPQSPPNSKLKCGGWKCGCELRKTDKPTSRGPLPALP